jgi:hypothetical protein
MNNLDIESDNTKLVKTGLEYPWILPFWWRVIYIILYMGGSFVITVGSYQYIPGKGGSLQLGGILFTVGSFGFVMVDIMEWWTNMRVGCFHYEPFVESYEQQYSPNFDALDTYRGRFQRAENGLIAFTAFIGSLFYQIGSIFFIPSFALQLEGTYLFIIGSGIVFMAQVWRLRKAGSRNIENLKDKTFKLTNIPRNIPMFTVTALCCGAGFSYFIGSFYFLPVYDVDTHISYEAGCWFMLGSILDATSSMLIFHKFFFTEHFTLDE